MKRIKVITESRGSIQTLIDQWFAENPDAELIDLIGGGVNDHGNTICYLIYSIEKDLLP